VIGHVYERFAARRPHGEAMKRLGVLLASGLIVGESLVGVVIAAIVAGSGKQDPLALVGPGFAGASEVVGAVAFAGAVWLLYRWVGGLAKPQSA
jgi:hypothetical protein